MRIGGASLMGSYHDKNQDSILAEEIADGWLIAVSDGLGSCRFSEIGSEFACRAIKTIIKRFDGIPSDIEMFFRELHSEWINSFSMFGDNYSISDCYATLLFCFVKGERIFAARLGDGIVGIKADNQNFLLFDNKEEYYDNETDCLFEEHHPEAWEVLEIECDEIEAVFVTTDGLSVVPHQKSVYLEFVNALLKEYKSLKAEDIVADIERWLPLWQTIDDRSIVFLLGE